MPIIETKPIDFSKTRLSYFALRRSIQSTGETIRRRDIVLGNKVTNVFPGQDIQKAIDKVNKLGGGTVFLKQGTHSLASDLILYDNINLEGEGIYNTIIDFNDNPAQIKIIGTLKTEAGTFTIDEEVNPKRVNGTATNFLSASAGDFFWIVNDWYEIESIINDTTLDLVDNYSVSVTAQTTIIATIKQKIEIRNLTITNCLYATDADGSGSSIANGNIYIKFARQLCFENIHSTFTDNSNSLYPAFGVFANMLSHAKFENIEATDNQSDGFKGIVVSFLSFEKSFFLRNGDAGLFFDLLTGDENSILHCVIDNNVGSNGQLRLANAGNAINVKIIGNTLKNGAILKIAGTASQYIIISNNNIDGQIYLSGSNCVITGNYVVNGISNIGIQIAGGRDNIIVGNILNACYIKLDTFINTVCSNQSDYFLPTDEQQIVYMKNTSGGSLAVGDLIILKAVATGDEITTTTTQGDDAVFGMVMETIANNAYGAVLKNGKTTALKVDGTTDIAIGDFIGSFTSAGIGMKAAAGDMAIAIALEAYTANDSSGVIDALLIKPRKI